MKRSTRTIASFVAAVALAATAARSGAAVVLSLGQPAVDLGPNQQATLPVFLEFTGAERATLIADGGLFSAGVLVAPQHAGTGASSFIAGAAFNSPTFGGGFSELTLIGVAPDTVASLYGEITDLDAGALGDDDGTTARVQLGTVTINAGPVAGQTDVFTLGVLDPDAAFISTNAIATALRDPVSFDSLVVPVSVAVNVVPEPGTAGTLAAGAVALVSAARRRRRRVG
jgi:hypothetical protein